MYPTYGLGTLIDILSMIMYILFFWTHVELLFFIFTEENFGSVNNFELLFLFCIFDTIFNVFGTWSLVSGKIFFWKMSQKHIGLSWNDSGGTWYLVKWAGYDIPEWERGRQLTKDDCNGMIRSFWEKSVVSP